MQTIHKFTFDIADTVVVQMPERSTPVSVATAGYGRINVWASVETDFDMSPVTLYVRGTGHPLCEADEAKFLGTVQDGPFVWHVFVA